MCSCQSIFVVFLSARDGFSLQSITVENGNTRLRAADSFRGDRCLSKCCYRWQQTEHRYNRQADYFTEHRPCNPPLNLSITYSDLKVQNCARFLRSSRRTRITTGSQWLGSCVISARYIKLDASEDRHS